MIFSTCIWLGVVWSLTRAFLLPRASRRLFRTFKNNNAQPEQSGFLQDLWWDLFLEKPTLQVQAENTEILAEALSLDAWRAVAFEANQQDELEEPPVGEERPPPNLKSYLDGTAVILEPHQSRIRSIYESVTKRGSSKNFNETMMAHLREGARIAYLQLWGKTTARSLEDSINRARGVAAILGDLHADPEVVIAGILQDSFAQIKDDEDVDFIRAEVVKRCGKVAVQIAEGYNRLPKFMARKAEYTPEQSEDHIQMLVTFIEDYRSLYIRVADRLHTMRFLRSLPLDDTDRKKIAQEALCVYAPLAHKMGIMKLKGELEDLAFRYLNPALFRETKYTQFAASKAYHQAADQILDIIDHDPYLLKQKNHSNYVMTYRIKDKYQLNLKMQRKELKSVKDVRDALGLRIIIITNRTRNETAEEHKRRAEHMCYYFVDKLRNLSGWVPAENGYKDYIAGVKENGYRSLHQYIKNKALGTNVEVQVRTMEMHMQAELGAASHWYYKDNLYRPEVANSKKYKLAWRSKQQMEEATSPAQLFGMAMAQLQATRIFFFLNDKATVLNLKRGSTALDAAFAIHTEVGLATHRVMVDGHPVSLDRPLQNGETISVETIQGKIDIPDRSWFDCVKTQFARHALRQYFKDRDACNVQLAGTAHLMMLLSMNAPSIQPDAYAIEQLASLRLNLTMVDLLVFLANATTTAMQEKVGILFDIPRDEVKTATLKWCLNWARQQEKVGWEQEGGVLRATVLQPILCDMLPSKGIEHPLQRWSHFIGPLTSTTYEVGTKYHSKMAKKFNSQERIGITARNVMPASSASKLTYGAHRPLLDEPAFGITLALLRHKRVSARPYSLEATCLPPPVLRIAKARYRELLQRKERRDVMRTVTDVQISPSS